jgi:hypothetical protein
MLVHAHDPAARTGLAASAPVWDKFQVEATVRLAALALIVPLVLGSVSGGCNQPVAGPASTATSAAPVAAPAGPTGPRDQTVVELPVAGGDPLFDGQPFPGARTDAGAKRLKGVLVHAAADVPWGRAIRALDLLRQLRAASFAFAVGDGPDLRTAPISFPRSGDASLVPPVAPGSGEPVPLRRITAVFVARNGQTSVNGRTVAPGRALREALAAALGAGSGSSGSSDSSGSAGSESVVALSGNEDSSLSRMIEVIALAQQLGGRIAVGITRD